MRFEEAEAKNTDLGVPMSVTGPGQSEEFEFRRTEWEGGSQWGATAMERFKEGVWGRERARED